VKAWIRAAGEVARGRLKAKSWQGQTLYMGHGSRRRTVKIYCKGDEIEAHKLSQDFDADNYKALVKYADNILRCEVTYRGLELKRLDMEHGTAWDAKAVADMYWKGLACMELPENLTLPDETVAGLPGRLQGVYLMWASGKDIRQTFPKRTFYRYRSELLKATEGKVDISIQQRKAETNNVVPLWRYLYAEPAGVPDWAIGTSLYWEPPVRQAR
jgi:II/X family phage/plasmid replication protein